MTTDIADVRIPDSKLAREATDFVAIASPLCCFIIPSGSTFGEHCGADIGAGTSTRLLYLGAMFHDVGLTEKHRSATDRFQPDSADAARRVPAEAHGVPEIPWIRWDAIVL